MKKAKCKKTAQAERENKPLATDKPLASEDTTETEKSTEDACEKESEIEKVKAELAKTKLALAALQQEKQTLQDQSMRLQAEYDNYRRRTQSEKERIYGDAIQKICKELLLLLDNLGRAKDSNVKQLAEQQDLGEQATSVLQSLVKGSELVYQQAEQLFNKLGVTEMAALGEKFNPDFHEAVMHVEDEQFGENEVVEVFQTGYLYGERVLRPAVVKVAN